MLRDKGLQRRWHQPARPKGDQAPSVAAHEALNAIRDLRIYATRVAIGVTGYQLVDLRRIETSTDTSWGSNFGRCRVSFDQPRPVSLPDDSCSWFLQVVGEQS
jgi:hypothetical protein